MKKGKMMMNKVHFVGAGPGDKELITLKGYKLLSNADVVIYAGSLVNPELLEYCKEDCQIHNSTYGFTRDNRCYERRYRK